jgi:ornithine cyclodeaminase
MIEFFGTDTEKWSAVESLASVVAMRTARAESDDLTLFKALGVGISDLSLGMELYHAALARSMGVRIPAPQRIAPRLGGKCV